jgi:hypothetical protein
MAGLIIPIAGRYSGAYTPPSAGALTIGVLNDDGYELSVQPKGEEVNATDAYGMSLLDYVYRGADWRLRYTGKEFTAAIVSVMWPWGMGASALSPKMGVIGRRASDVAGSLVLTAATGTPAASAPGPATLTAGLAIVSPNSNLAMLLTSKVRDVPVEMVLLPYTSGADVVWFTVT